MRMTLSAATLATMLCLPITFALAQSAAPQQESNNPNTWAELDALRIVKEIRSGLLSLSTYGVFDSLHFAIKGRTVIVEGYASRPILKSDAERVVKRIQGVESVDNQIEVLPLSTNDDRIRASVYRRIYTQATLRKYTGSPVGFGRFPSVARIAGGITQDPPIGFHAIHIIVNNGRVILIGVVDNEGDATIAGMEANMAPGTFSVDNDLMVAGRPAAKGK